VTDPAKPTQYRKDLLLTEQAALTQAIMACEGVAARKDRTMTRGALECATILTLVRDRASEISGLRKEMGRAKGRTRPWKRQR